MKLPVLIALFALCIATPSTRAQEEGLKDQTKPQIAVSDGKFLNETLLRNNTEIRMGELAKTKAGADAVKKLGDQLLVAHSQMNEEVKALAKRKAFNLWGEPDNIRISELRQLEGDAFDRAYLAEVVKHHEKAIGEFDDALKSSSDPELKAFAAKYLPSLRAHLAMVKRLATPEAVAPSRAASGL